MSGPLTLGSIQHGGRQEIGYLASSRQYGKALLGVRHQEEEGGVRLIGLPLQSFSYQLQNSQESG